jgi:hypothetical protein
MSRFGHGPTLRERELQEKEMVKRQIREDERQKKREAHIKRISEDKSRLGLDLVD